MEHLEMKDIESAVEGILFASGEPVATDRICVALEIDHNTAELVLQNYPTGEPSVLKPYEVRVYLWKK